MYFLFLFGSGIIIGLIVAAPIGPVNLICIRRTLAYGPLNGFVSGLGAALGDGVFAVVTAFGLTAISQGIEGYSTALKLAGGLMLLGFGLHIFNADVSVLRDAETGQPRDNGSRSMIRTIASTFALTITNPATLFGFAALFAGLGSLAGRETTFFDAAVTGLDDVSGNGADKGIKRLCTDRVHDAFAHSPRIKTCGGEAFGEDSRSNARPPKAAGVPLINTCRSAGRTSLLPKRYSPSIVPPSLI